MSLHRPRMRADTFNLIVAAVVLVLVASVAVGAMSLASGESCGEEQRQATVAESVPEVMVTYRFTDVWQTTLVSPSEDAPWRQDEVEAISSGMLSPVVFYGAEIPYAVAKPSVMARPEALYALAELVRGMPTASGVTLRLERGYLSWEAAETPGTSPYHTGYMLDITLLVDGVVMSLSEALSHPVASSPAAWIYANLSLHGFVRSDGGIAYVGTPHAALISERGESLSEYLAWVHTLTQETPYSNETEEGTLSLFYLPASRGSAQTEISESASVRAMGDGDDGFVVVVWVGRR